MVLTAEDLIKEGKLVEGRHSMDEGNSRCLDKSGYVPAKGTPVATDNGCGIFKGVDWHFYAVRLEPDDEPALARRISATMYEEQNELMKRLTAECVSQDRLGKTYSLRFMQKKSFATLELIMRAEAKGIYAEYGYKRFGPFADQKNRDIIYECLPFLLAERKADLLGTSNISGGYSERNRSKLERLANGLKMTPEETINAIHPLTRRCVHGDNYFIGGCYICEEECH